MTEAQAVEAIATFWIAGWTAAQPTIPFTLDNESFTAVATYADVQIQHETRRQISAGPTGARRFEARGSIVVTLYAPVNAGRLTLAGLADSVRVVLEGMRITVAGDSDPINTYGGSTREAGEDGAFCMAIVTVPFVWYQTR